MKFTKYFMPFAALALLASCSNDKLVDNPVGGEATGTAKGYLANFVITLPGSNGTRTMDAETDYEDGLADEYKVNSAVFYLFKEPESDPKTEDNYVYVAKSDVFYPAQEPDANYDITRQATITIQFNNEDEVKNMTNTSGTKYYGLCILNRPANFPEPDATTNNTFGTWKKITTNVSKSNYTSTNGFTMTNAPTFDGVSNNVLSGIHTLVEIDATALVEAPKTPTTNAGTFYVQRGVAKVKVLGATESSELVEEDVKLKKIPSSVSQGQYFQLDKWGIDLTNTESYPIQNVDNIATEMSADVDGSGVTSRFYTAKGSNIDFNHIWWGNDPNYNASGDAAKFTKLTDTSDDGWLSVSYGNDGSVPETVQMYDYCLENTMPFAGMTQDQTTRVLFKGKYSIDGSSFSSFVVSQANNAAVAIDNDYLISSVTSKSGTLASIIDNSKYLEWDETDNATLITKYGDYLVPKDDENIEATIGKSPADGKRYIQYLTYIALQLSQNIDGSGNVDFYKNGETFYTARIYHFDPTSETPWATTEVKSSDATKADYKPKHLGRYGVLRNNVYYINIMSVAGYGNPTIPTPDPNDPPTDDEPEPKKYNMQVAIKILQWAKRNYGYDLK